MMRILLRLVRTRGVLCAACLTACAGQRSTVANDSPATNPLVFDSGRLDYVRALPRARWDSASSRHFVLYVEPGTYAARHLAALRTRPEQAWTDDLTLLGTRDYPRRIHIFYFESQARMDVDSFPLFGFRLEDYDWLFAEHLDLLLEIRDHEHVYWSGKRRAPLTGQGVYPRPVQNPLPIWLGVGGTPGSAPTKWPRRSSDSEALGGISRLTFQMNVASLSQAKLMQAIEVLGTRVAPAVREYLAGR